MNEAEEWANTYVWLQRGTSTVPLYSNPNQRGLPTSDTGRARWFEARSYDTLAIHVRVPPKFDIRVYHAIECRLSFDGRLVFTWQVSLSEFKAAPSYRIKRVLYPVTADRYESREITIERFIPSTHNKDPHSLDASFHHSRPVPIEAETQIGSIRLEMRRVAIAPRFSRGPFMTTDMSMEKFWASDAHGSIDSKTHYIHLRSTVDSLRSSYKCLPITLAEPKAVFEFFYRDQAHIIRQRSQQKLKIQEASISTGPGRRPPNAFNKESEFRQQRQPVDMEREAIDPTNTKQAKTRRGREAKEIVPSQPEAHNELPFRHGSSLANISTDSGAFTGVADQERPRLPPLQQSSTSEVGRHSLGSEGPQAKVNRDRASSGSRVRHVPSDSPNQKLTRKRLTDIRKDLEEIELRKEEIDLVEELRLKRLAKSSLLGRQDETPGKIARLKYELAKLDIDLEEVALTHEQSNLRAKLTPDQNTGAEIAIAETEARLAGVRKARAEHQLKRKRSAIEEELSDLEHEETIPQSQGKRIKIEGY